MKVKIPFVNTSPETDLGAVFLLTPLWWVLGFNFFIYHAAALLVFTRLLMQASRSEARLKMPQRLKAFHLFLLFYAISLLVNAGLRPAQRLFASLNNYSMLIMGGMLMLTAYNSRPAAVLNWAVRNGRYLCFATGLLGVVSLWLWLLGYANLNVEPLAMRVFPALAELPYFNSLMIMKWTMTEWLFGQTPRLSLYSGAPTATSGFMLMIMPLMMAYYSLQRGKFAEYALGMALALFALLFSQSRSALIGWLAALIFVQVMARKNKVLVALSAFAASLFFLDRLYQGAIWLFNMRQASNVGRFLLYREALDIVWQENIFLGLGVRLRDEFTMTPIGSHAYYIELLFVTGAAGLLCFLAFQCGVALDWFEQQKLLKTPAEKVLWKMLGLAFWSTNLWLLTDSILAFPHIAYAYFLMTGSVLAFGRALRSGARLEWKEGAFV